MVEKMGGKISGIFGKGAEAEVRETVFNGRPALRKTRLQKKYRIRQLDAMLRARRTRREAKALRIARENGVPCPELFLEDNRKNELVIEKLEGILSSRKKLSCAEARQAGEILARLHNAGIIHGDFSTSNLMNVGGRVFVIDFGLSEFSRELEQRADDAIGFEKSVEGPEPLRCFRKGYAGLALDSKNVFARMRQILSRARYARGVA